MSDPQTKTVEFLLGLGYEIIQDSLWPILRHPDHGTRIQVAFDGRQLYNGHEKPESDH